ncbi:MAG: prolyl oligopeptidase family serine peptidase [Caldilineaceae bacterium]
MAHHVDDEGAERFFILTNWDAKNFRVMATPASAPGRDNWTEFIAHRPAVKVDAIEAFQGHLVLHEREDGLRNIRVHNLRTGNGHRISFNDPVYTYSRGWNPNYESGFVRYVYSSPVQPPTTYDYSMDGRYQLLRKEQEVPGYKPANYVTERLWATAPDGVRVPISLVYRRDLVLDGSTPMLLRGYGSYGSSYDPGFDSNRVALLDRDFIFATAHIRGGGDMGREWYENGKFLHKKNTFTDFIACAEQLIAEGYTRPDKLVINGRSAGGLLMGAVTNLRPDLFAGVIAGVPFVDVINTMLDPTIPLTVPEYEEWGNPNDPVYYAYMKSYSPYDNLEAKAYPAILATAGLNDPRVQYWEPAKWVAKLRTLKTDDNLLLLKTDMGAGHGGPSGRYDYLKEMAFEYAFMFKVLGMA